MTAATGGNPRIKPIQTTHASKIMKYHALLFNKIAELSTQSRNILLQDTWSQVSSKMKCAAKATAANAIIEHRNQIMDD